MISAPPKGGSLTSHASLLMFAKTVGFILSTALPMILVRRLDQTEFGLYKQAFLVVATSSNLLSPGFGMSAYYFIPRELRSPVVSCRSPTSCSSMASSDL